LAEALNDDGYDLIALQEVCENYLIVILLLATKNQIIGVSIALEGLNKSCV
jgi:hypothetical protein